jgi:hypothetical protein
MNRKPRLRIKGVMATVGPIKKGDKTYNLTEEMLKKAALEMIGKPIQSGHRGRPIGEVEKAWYENGKLFIEAVVYEPENEEDEEFVQKIEKGEIRGLSPSFTYEPVPTNVVLHGSLEIVKKKPDGTLVVRGKIPEEEIMRKLGSPENLKYYVFTDSWVHDGSQEAKSKIEDEFSKKTKTK